MKTAVVTGAGGFIGGALTKKLLENGIKVYGVDISEKIYNVFNEYKNFSPLKINLSTEKLSDKLHENIDVLFYLSWGGKLGGIDLFDYVLQLENVRTSVKTCEDSARFCKLFIFAASSYECMVKEHIAIPINIYGIAKKTAADMCASVAYRNNMDFNKAILTNTFGVGDRSDKAVNTIIKAMMYNRQLKLVDGKHKNDWVYIDDTVNGLISIADKGIHFKNYYIGHSDISTFKEKINCMKALLCPDRQLTFGEINEDTYVDYSCFDLNALYNDTGFECKSDFKGSILKTANWLKTIEPANIAGGGKIKPRFCRFSRFFYEKEAA